MKKWLPLLMSLMLVVIVAACNFKKDATEFLQVSFSGYDTAGRVVVDIDREALAKALYQKEYTQLSMEQAVEMEALLSDLTIDIDKKTNLTNNEVVKVTVSASDDAKKLKGGTKEVTVSGLEALEVITTEQLQQKLVVNFVGANGRGTAKIDNVFDNELKYIKFEIENDGMLKNGDQATIKVDDELKSDLLTYGYKVDEETKPLFEVKGLAEYAATAKDIANYDDVKRMIDEGINRRYKDSNVEWSFGRRYEKTLEKVMYRQFISSNDPNKSYTAKDDGTLIGIYTVKEYATDATAKLVAQKTVVYGFSNIVLDQDKKTNVANLVEVTQSYDDTYSLESVIKLYEGYGYTEVK